VRIPFDRSRFLPDMLTFCHSADPLSPARAPANRADGALRCAKPAEESGLDRLAEHYEASLHGRVAEGHLAQS
jgi:hypothetical protein